MDFKKDDAKRLAEKLQNYKEANKERAEQRDLLAAFMATTTLTQARKMLWGEKKKTFNCSRCHQKECVCLGGGNKKGK